MTPADAAAPRPDAARRFRCTPERPLALLARCPAYAPTPLRDLPALAAELGLRRLRVKEEGARMGLGSFKALGGVFAVAQMIRDAAGTDRPDDPAAKAKAAGMTFVTASAGNHGLSVAAGARLFGARCVILLDRSVPERFAERIRSAGAEVERVDGTYEDAVARAREHARTRGWLLLADGSWEGYVAPPALVMEGYAVLAEEIRAALAENGDWPEHVLLQAGVGGFAAAMAAHVRETWPTHPRITVVEPDRAACLARSVEAGALVRAGGEASNMGRLDCKDASLIAFETLARDADGFVAVSDAAAEEAARRLARHGVATTPSGAATLAALAEGAVDARGASVLIVATEGDVG